MKYRCNEKALADAGAVCQVHFTKVKSQTWGWGKSPQTSRLFFVNRNVESSNPDSVFLNPEYLASQDSIKKEDWENLLLANPDLPRYLVDYVEEQMSDPVRYSSPRIFNFVKEWIENPEKSFIYRNEIMFNNASKQMDISEDKWGSDGWKVEVPIISISF